MKLWIIPSLYVLGSSLLFAQVSSLQESASYYGQNVSNLISSLQGPKPIPQDEPTSSDNRRCWSKKKKKSTPPPTPINENPTRLSSTNLKSSLIEVLSKPHVREQNKFDLIVDSCDEFTPQNAAQKCTSHKVLGYKNARIAMFGDIHLQSIENTQDREEKEYFIKDIYCLKNFTSDDMPASDPVGVNLIPFHEVLNAEHVWPQSRFKDNLSKETGPIDDMKKSDIHILYPSDSKVNSLRSNYEFGEVKIVKKTAHCANGGVLGHVDETNKDLYFEPHDESKGNIARSIFYFSIRYNVPVNEVEEGFLRQWHESDPVDFIEILRNTKISALQNVRNPFIDYPHLVKHIDNF
jgi:deoxyribonuclease-1